MSRPPVHPVRRQIRNLAAGVVLLAGLALAFAAFYPLDPLAVLRDTPPFELLAVRIDALRVVIAAAVGLCVLLLAFLRCPRFAALGLSIGAWGLLPAWGAMRAEPRPPMDTAALRVLSVNLAVAGARTSRVVEEVRAADPDVVFFQEYTSARRPALLAALSGSYPVRHERARSDAFGMAVYARRPLGDVQTFYLADSGTPQFRIEVRLGDGVCALYGIHLVPITGPLYARHRREFAALVARLGRESRPAALVGDFNFVAHGALCGALRERGFLEAHALAGSGWGATWPVPLMRIGVPGIRIDHVFAGEGLTCTEAWVGGVTGSDHLPVGATITWARAGAAREDADR